MSKAGLLIWMVVLMGGMSVSPCYGVERAPRISDREIVEALTELKVGQRALNQRFEQVDQRFEQVDQRFEQVDKRFEQVDQRLGQMITLFLGMIAAFVGIVACTIGFALWDRRTALRPALARSDVISARQEKLERVLKEYAREESRLAEILESVGMLERQEAAQETGRRA